MLSLRAAQLGYGGQPVLADVDLAFTPGERVVILGPSGAGKTTLLRALYEQIGARAALVPQPHGLVGPLLTRHNIALGRIDRQSLLGNLRSLGWPSRAERSAIGAVAARLDLEDVLQQPAGTLSGGQQSRVAMARALYRGGDVLLADEPCAALDPRRAREALAALAADFETVICTMHDVRAGLELATRVIGVAGGVIRFDAPPTSVDTDWLAALYGEDSPGAPVQAAEVRAPRGCM